MKESKAVYVTKRDIRENLHRDYQWYTNNNIVNTIEVNKYKLTNDVGIQYNSKRDNIFYAHRNFSNVKRYHDHDLRYFNPIPKQIFTTYSRSKSFTDIGVGSVKALQKKKVKKIYLPETDDRGVGSSDLTDFITRMQSVQNKNKSAKQYKVVQSYYESKRTSSKCVGGAIENRPECLVSAKVSPIVHTQSGSTSPKDPGLIETPKIIESKDIEIGTVVVEKQFVTTDTQFEETGEEVEVEVLEVTNDEVANDELANDELANDKIEEIVIEPNVEEEMVDNMTKTPKHSTEAVVASVEVAPPEAKPSEPKLVVVLPEKRSEKPEQLKGSFSSDSLVQHVHNLEQPSEYSKQRDPMENKMEREYRKMFASISRDEKTEGAPEKQQIPQKSTSLFRRRFTAIRKSLGKKDSKNVVKQASVPSVRDASITSDPPSLEERSFSSINGYPSNKKKPQRKASYKRSYTGQKKSKTWSKANPIDSEYNQGVKGMFKLWGKKFNLDDTSDAKDDLTQPSSFDEKQQIEDEPKEKGEEPKIITTPAPDLVDEEKIYGKGKEKKEGKKFLFFKKKQGKDKTKNQKPENLSYKNKKGVTTGRCEVKDGLTLRMGAARAPSAAKSKTPPLVKKNISTPIEHYDDLVRTAWLMKYLSNPIESRNSVKIRWNNKTYTTSSSTVFELMGNVYKNTGVVLKSKSEITTDVSSTWSYNRPNVNFNQNVEAWMMPTTILDHRPPIMPKNKSENIISRKISKSDSESKNIEVTISDQKWIIDKSKAFAHKIEVVLHSKNFVKLHNPETSAEYIRIDIPKGFFSDSSSDDPQQDHTSDEEVYNIVEYESGNCGPAAKRAGKRSNSRDLNSGDHSDPQNIHVSVSVKSGMYEEAKIMETVIKRPPVHRDVVIQGSNVYIPKMCDVIGVGIITQRDVREVGKSILRVMEYVSEEESDHSDSKPCPSIKAKSYLEEYYRHMQPLGMDMFSLCYSDSHMQCCSEHNSRGSYNNGDASKSCPNIFEDYVAIMSSCCSADCCHETGRPCFDDKKNKKKQKRDKKKEKEEKKKEKDKPPVRVLPKDSLEVFKKRKIYAKEKSKWIDESSIGPYSCPSNIETGVQGQNATSCKGRKVCLPDLPDKLAKPARECPQTCPDNKPAGIIRYTAGEKKSAKMSPNIACTIPDTETCCRSEPCSPCSSHPTCSDSPPPCSFPSPCPYPPPSPPQQPCLTPLSRPAYGDCPQEIPAPCIKYGSPKSYTNHSLLAPSTCLPCPKSPPCPESPPCPPSPPKSPPRPKLPSPAKFKPPSPNKSPKPPSPAKSPPFPKPRPEGRDQGDCSEPPSPAKSSPSSKLPSPTRTCCRNPQTNSKPPSPNKSPPYPQSPSKRSPRPGSRGSKSSKVSSQKCQPMPFLPPDVQLTCPPCPPPPEKVRHRLPKPSRSPSSKSPSCVCTDAGSLGRSTSPRRQKSSPRRQKSSPQQQKLSPTRCSPKNCSPKRNSPRRLPSCEACSLSNEKGYTSVSSCSVYVEPVRSIFQSKVLQKTSLAHSLSVLNCEASLHKSVQCREKPKCGGINPPACPSEGSTQTPPICPPKPCPPPPCRPRCPTGIKLSNTECIKLPRPIRYGPPPCAPCLYESPCLPPPCPPPPCPPKTPPCPPPPCPPKIPPCPPKMSPCPSTPCLKPCLIRSCPPNPTACPPPPCQPEPCPSPPCQPPPFQPPPCEPEPCPPPPCPPKTPPCPQKKRPCPPKTPPCPPKTPPCPPKTPPCPPKTPPCPNKTPPCPTKTPPCPTKTPPCITKTRPCPPKTPQCPPSPCPPKTKPCPPKTRPCPPKPRPCPPKTPPCPKSPCDSTPPSPQRSPGCSPKASSCSDLRSTPAPCPPKSPSCSPKPSPCPSPPRCPHGVKISNTDCVKLPKPRRYGSPCPSCECHTPPTCPPGNKPCPSKSKLPLPSPSKSKLPLRGQYNSPTKSGQYTTSSNKRGSPNARPYKLTNCDKYDCPAAPKPHLADCCKDQPCCTPKRKPGKCCSPARSRSSSPCLLHMTSPPSPLQHQQQEISQVKCSCHTPQLSDQMIKCDASSNESVHKLHKSSCTPSTFLANVSSQYEEQGDYCDEKDQDKNQGDYSDENEACDDQGDYCDENDAGEDQGDYYDENDPNEKQSDDCDENYTDGYEEHGDYYAENPNVVNQSQSEPNQYSVDEDYMDSEHIDNHPKSQPNIKQIYNRQTDGINLKKFPRKVSNYTIPNLIRLNSKEDIMFKYNHDNENTHEMRDGYVKIRDDDNVTLFERKDYANTTQACMNQIYNDQQNQRITAPVTVNEVASVERDKKVTESKSTDSVVNMIEINFKLRVIQGDKTTEINIANEDSKLTADEKSNTTNKHYGDDAKEVYILKDENTDEEVNPKNDLNIRIIIKNYKPKEPSKEKKIVNEFAQKISKKFNTVSTGYSVDFRGEHTDETCFSVHRATIDLTTSERSVSSNHNLLMKRSEVKFKDSISFEDSSSKKVKSEELLSQTLENNNEVLSSGQAISATENLTSVTETESISEVGPGNSNTLLTLSEQTKSLSFGRSKHKSDYSLSVHSAIIGSKKPSRKRIDHISSKSLRLRSSKSILRKRSKTDEDISDIDNKYHNPELVTFKESKKSVKVKDIFKSQARLSYTDTDEHDISLGNKTSEEPTSKSLNARTSEDHTDPTDFAKSSDPDSDTKTSEVLIEKVPTEEIQYIDLGKSKKEEKKEMLKAVFDSANYFKKPKTRNRIQKLKDMLKALLTSDTDTDTDHSYQKLAINTLKCAWDPKAKHHSDSLNNFFEGGSMMVSESHNKSHQENYSSLQSNKSAYSEDEEKPKNKTCLCSDFAEKLKMGNIMGGGCCCRGQLPETVSEQISCNFINELTFEDYSYFAPSVECVHCQTNNSRYKSSMTCAKIISINSKRSSFIPHSQKTSSLTPHSQEEAYTLYNLDIEPFSSKLSNKSYKWAKEYKDNSSRDGTLLQEDTDNPETEPISDRMSIKSYEKDRKLKEDSSRENYYSEEASKEHKEIREDSSRDNYFLEKASEEHKEFISAKVSLKEYKREKVFDKKTSYEAHLHEVMGRKYSSSTKSLRMTEEDKDVLQNKATNREKPDINRKKKKHHTKVRNQADVLQMYETKKAVLEIYAEKTVTDGGEHLVAKLPKYARDTESELYQSFEQLERNSYKSVYKRNFVMMCIGR